MDLIEFLVFMFFGFLTIKFFAKWYRLSYENWPSERIKLTRNIFILLPVIALVIIIYTLMSLASFDVVNDFIYIFFYIVMGYACINFGLFLMFYCFDISWIDDVLNLNNKAALVTITGGFLGLTIIYSGANIGNGPGWWCVIFAGGLGLAAWICLGSIINLLTKIFERITIGRDISCGVRFGLYLIAGGIILGRASAGDWTSFNMTVIEFMDGWPVLPLTAFMILIEQYYISKSKTRRNIKYNHIYSSIFWGIIYIVIAVVSVILLPPLKENPIYESSLYNALPALFI